MASEGELDQVSDAVAALRGWLNAQADTGLAWLDEAVANLAAGAPDRALFAAFADAPRRVGRDDLPTHVLRPGLRLAGWTRDQVARVLLLLARPRDEAFLSALGRMFAAADLAELVCLYQALPLLPFPERHVARAAEGVRSNMLPVFQGIAVANPYPAEWLDEGAWNQMVVKAVFVGCPLHGIVGLDRRANPALARMLVDYACERRAAGRAIPPDLWRPVGPFADEERTLHELRHALSSSDRTQQHAAALALSASPHPGAKALLDTRPELSDGIRAGRLRWEALAA